MPHSTPEARAAYNRAYRQRNSERLAARKVEQRASRTPEDIERDRDYMADYYAANKLHWERRRETARLAARARRRASQPSPRTLTELLSHRVSEQNRRRRQGGAGISKRDWSDMLDFFGHRCFFEWCENPQVLHMAHIVALAEGGAHEIGNVVPLCATHNLEQGVKDFYSYFAAVEAERARSLLV